MFLLSFIPDWIFYILLLLSVIGTFISTFLSNIPFIATYAKPIQYCSIILLIFSVYMIGGIANEDKWEKKILEQQIEIAELKEKETKVTTKVVTKYIDKITVIKENSNEISKYISDQSNDMCQLPVSFSVLHDAAAKNQIPDPARVIDERTSTIKLSEATNTIVANYSACNQNSEQLKSLQEWIREQQKLNP